MEHPVSPNSSVPQAVLQPYLQRSESSLSLDGQGEHAVSEKKCCFSFCYPPTVFSALKEKSVKQKTPQREPCLKVRKILDFAHAVFVTSCSFCWTLQFR